jgi:hypothetical protein
MKTEAQCLQEWDNNLENQKVEFMDFLYERSGRTNGLYTNLWAEWDAENEGYGREAKEAYFANRV